MVLSIIRKSGRISPKKVQNWTKATCEEMEVSEDGYTSSKVRYVFIKAVNRAKNGFRLDFKTFGRNEIFTGDSKQSIIDALGERLLNSQSYFFCFSYSVIILAAKRELGM